MFPRTEIISTIFRTIETDAKGLTNQLGILGKSFRTIKNDLSQGFGVGFSLFGGNGKGISQSDVSAINAYYRELDNCVSKQTAWNRTMLNTSKAAQSMVINANGARISTERLGQAQELTTWQTIKLTAASVALNAAITLGASILLSLGIKAFTHLYNIQGKIAEKTKELTDSLKSQTDEYNNLKSELDDVNNKLKDNESRYSELIDKQKESGLTTEESGELEELQRITGELTNQKNILEENIRLKKESAASTAQELANSLLKQEDVKDFMDGTGGKIKSFFNEMQKSSVKMMPIFGKLYSMIDAIISLFNIEIPKDSWLNKIANIFDGTAVISWLTGTDIEEDSYDEAVSKYEDLQKKMKAIRDKYDKNGDGIIDSNASMSAEDSESYKKYYDESVEVANNLKTEYQELDDAIKAIEADPNLTQVNKEELERLKAARDVIADILGYKNEGKTGDGIVSDEDVKNANIITASLETLNKELDSIQDAYQTVSSAIKEYNENGYLSVDAYQKLLELSPEYIGCLIDENGNLTLNTEALKKLTYARIDELAVKKAEELVDTVTGLSTEKEQLEKLTATRDLDTISAWENVEAKIAKAEADGKISDGIAADLRQRISLYKKSAELAKKGVTLGGMGGDNAKDKAKKQQEIAKKISEAWKKEYLERLKDNLSVHEEILNQYEKQLELHDFEIDIIPEENGLAKFDAYSKKLNTATKYSTELRKEFERVASIIPETADQAQEIANRIEELGSELRDNAKTIRETIVDLNKARVESMSNLMDAQISDFESEINRLDGIIESLRDNTDNHSTYSEEIAAAGIMFSSLSTLNNKKVKEQEKIDKELIDLEEETQNTINKIVTDSLETQIKENAKAREEERNELIAELNEIGGIYKESMNGLSSSTKNTMQSIMDDTKVAMDYLKAEFDTEFKIKVDRSELDDAIEDTNLLKKSALGFQNPLATGRITSYFGTRTHPQTGKKEFHSGIDIGADGGTIIYAAKSGIVTYSGEINGYGYTVQIDHGDGYTTRYSHMLKPSSLKVGDSISIGQPVGLVGSTGRSTGPHLDFGVYHNGTAVDPLKYIPGYAQGTDNAPGGKAWVGEEGVELAITPDGKVHILGENGLELADLPENTKVLTAEESKEILNNPTKLGTEYSVTTKSSDLNVRSGATTNSSVIGSLKKGATIVGGVAEGDWIPIMFDGKQAYISSKYLTPTGNKFLMDNIDEKSSISSDVSKTVDDYPWASQDGMKLFYDKDGNIHVVGVDGLTADNIGLPYNAKELDENDRQLVLDSPEKLEAVNKQFNIDKWKSKIEADTETFNKEKEWAESQLIMKLADLNSQRDNLSDEEYANGLEQIQTEYAHSMGELAKSYANNAIDLFSQYNNDFENGLVDWSPDVVKMMKEYYDSALEMAETADNTINENIRNAQERRRSLLDKYIEDRDFYGDWDSFVWTDKDGNVHTGDKKSEAIGRVLEWAEQTYPYDYEFLEQLRKDKITAQKEEFESLLSDIENCTEAEIEGIQKLADECDNLISKYSAMKSIKESEFNFTNKLIEAQQDIDKQLATSLVSTQYLDEETKKLIFNEDDYKYLSSKIKEIQNWNENAARRYYSQIESLGEDELYLKESITAEYERQLAIKEKELATYQAEVNLKQKEQQLNNVLAEKNVRMLVGNRWEWVADTDKVRQATEELKLAQNSLENARREKSQQVTLNSLQWQIDSSEAEKAAYENQINMIEDATKELKKAYEKYKNPVKDIADITKKLSTEGIPGFAEALNKLTESMGGKSTSYKVSSGGSSSGSGSGKSTTYIVGNDGRFYNVSKGSVTNGDGTVIKTKNSAGDTIYRNNYGDIVKTVKSGYASGTLKAIPGLHRVDEDGTETYISDSGTFHKFNGGETVFNAEQTKNLYKMSLYDPSVQFQNMADKFSRSLFNAQQGNNTTYTFTGGINISEVADLNHFLQQVTQKAIAHNQITKNQ